MFYPEFSRFRFHRPVKTIVGRIIKFLQGTDLQSILDQTGHYFPQMMIPGDGFLSNGCIPVSISPALRFHDGVGLEIIIADLFEILIKHPHDGVEFHKNELPAGFQKIGDHFRPATEVR